MDQEWGTGPKNFLRTLYDKQDYENFFNDILEYLFYDALATDRYDDYYEKFECKIPFLNGGLFEPIKLYNWRKTQILLENRIFGKILDTFDRFNFTIKEDEPLERIVAVDPEMLGKVFENLLDVKNRKSKGAFYTPREIVHYMCQQSLINYLNTNSNIKIKDIENFIQLGDFALDSIIRAKEFHQPIKRYSLPESIKNNYEELDKLLKEVKIVDPAVGSGAFPVGMMNEILKARSILSLLKDENKTNYDIKREIIENSLYGVDIDSSAVDVTKLRFWLSLIVDEEHMGDIKPLPNLDHKIMCGNSLLEEFNGIKLFDENILTDTYQEKKELLQSTLFEKVLESRKKLKRLQKVHKLYFNEQNKKQKEDLRSEINKIEWELIEETIKEKNNENALIELQKYKNSNSKPFFLWKLYFSEIFKGENPGFDIVIANPPYVENKKISAADKINYKKYYSSAYKLYDLSVLFIEKSINLLKDDGFMIFITTNKFLASDYGIKIRKLLMENVSIRKLIDVSYIRVFKEAAAFPVIISYLKTHNESNDIKIYPKVENIKVFETGLKNGSIIKQKDYNLTSNIIFNISNNIELCVRISKMDSTKKLGELDHNFIYRPFGFTDWGEKVKNLSSNASDDSLKFISTPNIFKYHVHWNKKITVSKQPVQKEYMPYNSKFEKKWKELKKDQIMIKEIALKLTAAYSNGEYCHLTGIYGLNISDLDNKFVLALLNSKLMNFFYNSYYGLIHLTGGYLKINSSYLKSMPIVLVSQEEQNNIINLVNKILSITNDEEYLNNSSSQTNVLKIEEEIDHLIYGFYKLTSEEINIIEEFNNNNNNNNI